MGGHINTNAPQVVTDAVTSSYCPQQAAPSWVHSFYKVSPSGLCSSQGLLQKGGGVMKGIAGLRARDTMSTLCIGQLLKEEWLLFMGAFFFCGNF